MAPCAIFVSTSDERTTFESGYSLAASSRYATAESGFSARVAAAAQ